MAQGAMCQWLLVPLAQGANGHLVIIMMECSVVESELVLCQVF
jgi:hypothetical protein